MKTLLLLDGDLNTLSSVTVRETDEVSDAPLRNLEGVQPPGSLRQAAFGSGLMQAGELRRLAAVCSIVGYADVYAAKAALERALLRTRWVQLDNWRLPIAAWTGIDEWSLVVGGFKGRIGLIPASPYWRYLVAAKVDAGSQSAQTVTGTAFASGDVGRLIVFASGAEALITGFTSATSVTVDADQTVAPQALTVYVVTTGVL